MAKKVAITNLNASTLDIINTIRANASYEYQSLVPEITSERDIPAVGDILYGYPALANQFINSLVNRIAQVRVKSATFNNAYAELKKGYLEFGETVEEVFVSITKAREFSVEKAPAREFKRTLPDVRTAFHTMNWRVQYPITIQNEELRQAFTSFTGVEDLIARIVSAVYTAAEYDEYLLFKYLIIKGITKGKMHPVSVDTSDIKNAAKAFRGTSNQLQFMSSTFNNAGVTTATPKADQYIFMDAQFNANYDVDVLASAFNMDNATFSGKLKLIDSFSSFDNDRFSEIVDNTTQIERVTDEELALMQNVIGVLVDGEWFQVYDNLSQFTEAYVSNGLYWNYFYNIWKTVSTSPFSNAVVFVDSNTNTTTTPQTMEIVVTDKSVTDTHTILTVDVRAKSGTPITGLPNQSVEFVQTETAVENGIAVHRYGTYIIPNTYSTPVTVWVNVGGVQYTSGVATSTDTISINSVVGDNYDIQRNA